MTHKELINSTEYKQAEREIFSYFRTKRILIAFTALLLLGGCKTHQSTISTNTSQRNDSIVTIVVKDTFIKWLPQLQSIKTNQKSKLSTDFAFSEAWIDSVGLLNHSIQNNELIPSKIIEKKTSVKKEYHKTEYKELHITKTEKIYQTKKTTAFLGKLDWILIGLAFLLIGLAFLFWVYKLYRKFKI